MLQTVWIEEDGPLSQKIVCFAKRIFNGPVHSAPDLPFTTRDVDSAALAAHFIQYRGELHWTVRDWEAYFNTASGERLPGKNPHWSHDMGKKQALRLLLPEE